MYKENLKELRDSVSFSRQIKMKELMKLSLMFEVLSRLIKGSMFKEKTMQNNYFKLQQQQLLAIVTVTKVFWSARPFFHFFTFPLTFYISLNLVDYKKNQGRKLVALTLAKLTKSNPKKVFFKQHLSNITRYSPKLKLFSIMFRT